MLDQRTKLLDPIVVLLLQISIRSSTLHGVLEGTVDEEEEEYRSDRRFEPLRFREGVRSREGGV